MVNVFSPHRCPVKSAVAIDNKRLSRMCYEAYEVLSSAILRHKNVPEFKRLRGKVYRASKGHLNHPAVHWVLEDGLHFEWLLRHAAELNEQYQLRYKKLEACKPHRELFETMTLACKHVPRGKYDHGNIEQIEFVEIFGSNYFARSNAQSKSREGHALLPENTGTQTRYRLYLLHKWLYEDS